jgi:hypothetical protein
MNAALKSLYALSTSRKRSARCPEAAVFFTGYSYDTRLCSTFPGVRFVRVGEFLVRLEHPTLPFHAYRTPHPKWLRLKEHWDTLHQMAQEMGTRA